MEPAAAIPDGGSDVTNLWPERTKSTHVVEWRQESRVRMLTPFAAPVSLGLRVVQFKRGGRNCDLPSLHRPRVGCKDYSVQKENRL